MADRSTRLLLRAISLYKLLASYDQFANLVLDAAVERIVVQDCFADVPFGIFVVRGENVMLLGEVDASKEAKLSATLNLVTEAEILRALAAQREDRDSFRRGERFAWPIPEEY
jgi:U6 snRNA-associated Sm-like protein LSm1